MNIIQHNNLTLLPVNANTQYSSYQEKFNDFLKKNNLKLSTKAIINFLDNFKECAGSTQRKVKTALK